MSSYKKLAVSDMDGTIITKDNVLIEETKKSIKNFMQQTNNAFSIVTGRQFFVAERHIKDLNITLPILTANGSTLIDPTNKKILKAKHFEKEEFLNNLAILVKNQIKFSVVNDFQVFGLKSTVWNKHFRRDKFTLDSFDESIFNLYDTLEELFEAVKSDCKYFGSFFIEYNDESEFQKIINLFPLEKFSTLIYCYFHHNTIEYFKKGVNKYTGLEMLADYLNMKVDDFFIFGDQTNDIVMFENAKNTYAVKNAVPQLKLIAKEVIGSVENDGVGKKAQELIKYF
ncbi:HAD superfamily hydrolase [Spiroplasma helicoides]|uniref:HAD superfamily hydrolase n=1 Tax=Spiroplasma helicoides TaxID=216938 RepID=A0A1B3SKL7_9MOLU|nr:HAD-IIB family hydrolase [Spiroplasma helicoides]AOG60482.1 HAD superfamily hydrolase [Spiroplasma helicoides]